MRKFRCWQRWRRTKRRESRNFPTPTSFGSRHHGPHRNYAKLFFTVWRRIWLPKLHTCITQNFGALTIRPPTNDRVTLWPKCSTPMDRHRALPISGSWLPGAARAVDGASLLHGLLRVNRNAETGKKVNGWMECGWTQCQGINIFQPTYIPRTTYSIISCKRIFFKQMLFSAIFQWKTRALTWFDGVFEYLFWGS